MKNKILFVEDESDLRLIITDVLREEGYVVLNASNGLEGLKKVKEEKPDIIVADVMMPQMDGFKMAKEIRKLNSKVPILFLTAKSSIEDLEEGFEVGANDYLKKPFELRELIVRIKALLRKNIRPEIEERIYEIGKYLFNSTSQILKVENTEYNLSNFESKILEKLVANIGFTVDSTEMMMEIWQNDDISNRNSLHGYIHKLRRFLSKDPKVNIINQRGFGYMLIVKRNCGLPNQC